MSKKIALVTGGSRGIGAAVADTLAKDGFQVIATATSSSGAASITDRLHSICKDSKGMVLDVSDAGAVDVVLSAIHKQYGGVDALVNNAGLTRDNLLMRMSEDEWDLLMDTNLKSVFRMSKGCLRAMMKKRHGRIISISSVVATMGNAGQANYAAAKAAINGFSRSLAREVGARGITVNTVAPGFIDTDMTRALPENQRKSLLTNIPANRLGDVQDIANVVSFLASDKAAYITGQTIHVNGGMVMA